MTFDSESIIKSIIVSVGIAFITPALVQIVRAIFGTGTFAIGAILAPIKKMLRGLFWIGKYISIPLAAFVLFSPDSLHVLFPQSSMILGICILLIAAMYLIFAMFTGLREALAICFWACICLVVVSAFHLDRLLPKGEVQRALTTVGQTPPLQAIQDSLRTASLPSKSAPLAQKSEAKTLGALEFSSFDARPKNSVKSDEPQSLELLSQTAAHHYSSIESQVSEFLSPALDVFNHRDQSFKGLSSDMYFEKKRDKKQHYGFSNDTDTSTESTFGGIESFLANLIK